MLFSLPIFRFASDVIEDNIFELRRLVELQLEREDTVEFFEVFPSLETTVCDRQTSLMDPCQPMK